MPHTKELNSLRGCIYYLLAATFLLYEMSVQSSPSIMALSIMGQLHIHAGVFGTAMGAYFLSYALMQIPGGLLFDRFSSKTLLIFATLMCAVGSLVLAYSAHIIPMAAARFVTGLGSAFAFVGVLVIADKWFSAQHFPLLVGLAQLLAALGAMVGEMPLAYWVHHFGWSTTCLILAFLGLLLMVGIAAILPTEKTTARKKRTSVSQSLQAILKNSQTYWVALYAFAIWSPITLFAELWGVPYLSARYPISNIDAAFAISLIWIGLAVTSPCLGWYAQKLQQRKLLLQLCAWVGLLCTSLMLCVPKLTFPWVMALLPGIGIAAAGQILTFSLVKDNNTAGNLAAAIGFNNMAVVVGGAIFQPAVGFLLEWHARQHSLHGIIHETNADYSFALSVMILLYLIAGLCSYFLINEKKTV